jgi:hypothetical protein
MAATKALRIKSLRFLAGSIAKVADGGEQSCRLFGSPKDAYTKALFAAAPGRTWEFGKFATA